MYRCQGDLEEAEPLYRESLAIDKKVYGEEHPQVAQALNELTLLLWKLGRHDEAIPYQEQAVRIKELRHSPDYDEYKGELDGLRAHKKYPYR